MSSDVSPYMMHPARPNLDVVKTIQESIISQQSLNVEWNYKRIVSKALSRKLSWIGCVTYIGEALKYLGEFSNRIVPRVPLSINMSH